MRKFLITSLVLALVLGLSGLALAQNNLFVNQNGSNFTTHNKAYHKQVGPTNTAIALQTMGALNQLGLHQKGGGTNTSTLDQRRGYNYAKIEQDGNHNKSYATQNYGVNDLRLWQENALTNLSTLTQDEGTNFAYIAQEGTISNKSKGFSGAGTNTVYLDQAASTGDFIYKVYRVRPEFYLPI